MRRLAVVVLVTIATMLLAAAPTSAAEPGTEADFVAAVNRVRAGAGLASLQVHPELEAAARVWADAMASENRISHRSDLSAGVSANWTLLGENVGTGYDVPTLMDAFVASAPHYRNLVDPRFDWIGVGVTWGTDGRLYTAHVFMDTDAPAGTTAAPASAPAAAAAPAPAAAPVAAGSTAPSAPAPVAPSPPAAVPERLAAVLAAVRALGADGVA